MQSIGKGKYVLAEYEKIKRITMPLNDEHLLYITTEPEANRKGQDTKSIAVLKKYAKIKLIKTSIPLFSSKIPERLATVGWQQFVLTAMLLIAMSLKPNKPIN
jgi:adenine specific DNA methylase Mod